MKLFRPDSIITIVAFGILAIAIGVVHLPAPLVLLALVGLTAGLIAFANIRLVPYLIFLTLVAGQLFRFRISGGSSASLLLIDGAMGVYVLIGSVYALMTRIKFPLTLSIIFILTFLGWVIVTLLLGVGILLPNEQLIALFYAVRFILMVGAFVLTTALFPKAKQHEKLFSGWLMASGGLIALGFAQLIVFPNFAFMAQYGWDPHVGRLLSTFFDPNFFGMFLVLVVSFAVAHLLVRRQVRTLWFSSLLVTGLAALVLTFSRSSYLAFLISMLFILIVRSRKLVVICLIALAVILVSVPRVRTRIVGALTVDATAQDRIQSWNEASSIIKDRPFVGVGYNAYGPAQLRNGIRQNLQSQAAQGSDSSWLLILATTGYVGFIIMTLYMLTLFFESFLVYRYSSSPYIKTMGLALLGLIPGYFVHSQFVNSLFYPLLFVPFGFMISGVLIGLQTLPPPKTS